MNKLFKGITAAVLALVMLTFGAPAWATTVATDSVSISVTIADVGEYSLSASLVDLDGDGGMTFDTSSVSTSDAWVVSSDYVEVNFSGPTNATWGVKIVSDNVKDLLSLSRDESTNTLYYDSNSNGSYDAGEEVSQSSSDTDGDGTDDYYYYEYGSTKVAASLSGDLSTQYYSGLIDSSSADNPNMRASLAFMVDGYDTSGVATSPSIPSAPTVDDTHGGSTEIGDWDDPWYWMGDKSTSDYDDLVDSDGDGTADEAGYLAVVYYTLVGSTEYITPNYSLVAYGTPYGRYLNRPGPTETANDGVATTRPLEDIGTPDATNQWTAYTYLLAKFANTDWSTSGEPDFVLPSGNYTTTIYYELYTD